MRSLTFRLVKMMGGGDLTLSGFRFVQTASGNEAARAFGMGEAPVPVKKSVEFLVATVRISSDISALGAASLMDVNCRLTVPLETRLLAISHPLKARTGPGKFLLNISTRSLPELEPNLGLRTPKSRCGSEIASTSFCNDCNFFQS